jgi:alkanesulfonate monooxygenase SsuD/methylene tetrahydromethanopterin reductase-like flavin-dependent oxidoreductase (luciferase family)
VTAETTDPTGPAVATAGTGLSVRSGLSVGVFLLAGHFPAVSQAQTLRLAVDYARAAEQAGFAGVWLAEHHFIRYGVCPSAVTFAAHLLGATRTIEVGTAAAILPNRHPVALAEEATLLDAVSGGRFRLGVARGGPWVDLEVFGTGLARYEKGFAESLDLLLRALREPSVDATGEFFQFRPVQLVPRPQRPVPVWVAATSAATVDLTAERGLPLLLGMHEDETAKAAMIARHGAPGLPHVSAHLTYVSDSRAQAEAALRASLPGWLSLTREYTRLDGTRPDRDIGAYLEHLLRISPIGTPEECVYQLNQVIAATGARRLLLMVEAAGEPRLTRTNIQRLGAEVLPHLTATTPLIDANAAISAVPRPHRWG